MIKPLEDVKRDAILEALVYTRGNKRQAARGLEISVRTLRTKIKKYKEQGHFVPSRQTVYDKTRAGYEYE